MKSNFTQLFRGLTTFIICIYCTFCTISAVGQCVSPTLKFHSPVLINGPDKLVGAVYNFANVGSGIDAHVQITGIFGGATLYNIDDSTGIGYYDAFQPYVGAAARDTSYIDWRITFKVAGTNRDTMLSCLSVTGVDVDGDASALKEFIEAATPGSIAVDPYTNLSVTFDGVRSKAISPIANVALIDTNHREAMFQMNFTNISTLDYRNGAITTGGAQIRQTCIYFKPFFNNSTLLLPVKLLSFTARSFEQTVELKWSATEEESLKHYTIQKSEDGKSWYNIGNVSVLPTKAGVNNYLVNDFSDISVLTYYRLMILSKDGGIEHSTIVKIKPFSKGENNFNHGTVFTNKVVIQSAGNPNGEYIASVYSMNGNLLAMRRNSTHAGTNSIVVDVPPAAAGVYLLHIKDGKGREVYQSKLIRVNQ